MNAVMKHTLGRRILRRRADPKQTVTIRYGSSTVTAVVDPEKWAHNIRRGQEAMAGLAEALVKLPGVKLPFPKSVPLFRADPDNPSQVIRLLNDKEERGIFVDGVFTAQ